MKKNEWEWMENIDEEKTLKSIHDLMLIELILEVQKLFTLRGKVQLTCTKIYIIIECIFQYKDTNSTETISVVKTPRKNLPGIMDIELFQ